jgi:hypothetical protein
MTNYEDLKHEAIYLLREREHIMLNNPIYKIGKTKQEGLTRFSHYPKGSELILHMKVKNCDLIEREIISLFKKKYSSTEFGNESFKGNELTLKKDIIDIILNEEENINIQNEKVINMYTEEEIRQQHISAFISEKIVKTDNEKDKIGKRGLHDGFKQWFELTQGSRKAPKGEELFEYMNKKFGDCKSTGWHGVKFVGDEEDEDFTLDEI